MADISKIKSLDGNTSYNIKDATARNLLNGHSVEKDVPSDAKFTDTTYSSKSAASGGTEVSLVTTGEKYTWNNKGTYSKPSGGIPASDLASGVIPTVPSAYTSNPAMDGTASAGSSGSWAKGDHVHPTDTSRQAKITASGILKGNGSGGISAATAGTDYGTYSKPSGGIPASDLAQTYAGGVTAGGAASKAVSIPMGAVDSTSTSTVFTATVDGITELRDGIVMWLSNGVVTSAAGFTLNINGLGAKPVYSSLAAATADTTAFNVNYTMLFIYNSTRVDGGCWDMVRGYDSNTTYTAVKLGFGYGACDTAAATIAKTVTLSSYTLQAGGIVNIKFTYAVPASATLNINSKGAKNIRYRGSNIKAGVINAGDIATLFYDGTRYNLISVDSSLKPTIITVSLSASWSGSGPYTQTVTVTGYTVTANTKVDLQPNADQIAQLIEDGVQALYIANNNGTLTAYAVGAETSTAMTVQCTVMEVVS